MENNDLILELGGNDDLVLEDDTGESISLEDSVPYYHQIKSYEELNDRPMINGNELIGNKTTRQLGIEVTDPMTNMEIESIFQSVFAEG